MDKISIVIIMVVICRFFVGKVSKQASYFLWGIVALRLLFPVMMPSSISIFNFVGEELFLREERNENYTTVIEETVVTHEYIAPELPKQTAEDVILPNAVTSDKVVSDKTASDKVVSEKNEDVLGWERLSVYIAVKDKRFFLWCIGVTAMLGYGCVFYWRLKYRLRFATKMEDGIFESEQVTSPFVFGVLKPVIYLPLDLGSTASRRASPTRLIQMVQTPKIAAVNTQRHQYC